MQETYDIDDRHIGKSPQPRDAHYEPTTIILGLVALCLAFLAPTLFVLWRWRPSRQQDADDYEQQHYTRRSRASSRSPTWGRQSRGAWPLRDVEAAAAARVGEEEERPLSVKESLRQLARASRRAIVEGKRAAWKKTGSMLAGVRPRDGGRQRGNTGVSIDLPIMSRPAWQKLASGAVVPSKTLDDRANGAASGDEANRVLSGERTAGQQHKGADMEAQTRAEMSSAMAPLPALTVGLAIG